MDGHGDLAGAFLSGAGICVCLSYRGHHAGMGATTTRTNMTGRPRRAGASKGALCENGLCCVGGPM